MRRIGAVAVCVAAVMVVLMLAPGLVDARRDGGSVAGGPAVLPRVLGSSSVLARSANDAPAGPATMLVGYADLPGWGDLAGGGQELAVGADGHGYRTLAAPAPFTGITRTASLLSPDGTRALVGEAGGTLRLVDLTTGRSRGFRLRGGGYTRALAFSPDGRYAVAGGTADPDSRWVTPALLDLRAGTDTPLGRGPSSAAAFSPDGTRVAIQHDGGITVLDRDTGRGETALTDPGSQLAGAHAWSPDGRWLAMSGDAGGGTHFIPAGPADPTPRLPRLADQTESFVGWASPTTIIATDRTGTLVAQPLPAGPRRALTTLAGGSLLEDIATTPLAALAAHPRTSAARPDYGPRPAWWTRLVAALAVALAALVALAWPRPVPLSGKAQGSVQGS